MKYIVVSSFFILVVVISFISCENQAHREERLAKQYCGSCHVFPEPSLLSKKIWETGVLPQMAFRMGFEDFQLASALSQADLPIVFNTLPGKPMVTKEEWEAIKNYYITNAPDSITPVKIEVDTVLNQFDAQPVKLPIAASSLVTLIKTDTVNHKIFIGTRLSKLYQFNAQFKLEDSIEFTSPPSWMTFEKDKQPVICTMGNMDPNDQPLGSLSTLSMKSHATTSFIDSLKRPVYFEYADFNNDNLQDYVICAFGNYTGALLIYENQGHGKYKQHVIYNRPGARKVVVTDFNKDGLKDVVVLMTQGDEQVMLLTNASNFDFRQTSLLRFPPVYGSSYFDIADFNKDGHADILYSNGDNADYSMILKPYHGVRIFLNDGHDQFSESWFQPMNGASQVIAKDFDKDGDLDIAAISFFPDFKKNPEQGFIYFENDGKTFVPHTTTLANTGRWIVMEATDIDHDEDEDLLLGALNFNSKVPHAQLDKWAKKRISILVLKNKLHQ